MTDHDLQFQQASRADEPALPQDVRDLLAHYQALGPDGRRRFHEAALNPQRYGLEPRPGAGNGGSLDAPNPPEIQDSWQVFTLADAYVERQPVEYIAAGLFALPSLNIVYGAPGTLKSFLMADLAVCASAGQPWLEAASWVNGNQAAAIPTRQLPVMWVDFDNGRRRTHDRFGALGRAHHLPVETSFYYHSMDSPWLDAGDKKSISALLERMLRKEIKFLVVDNLGVVSGDADENSGEMVRVMSEFRQLAELTGAAVVLIHHQRKSTGNTSRAGDSLRGHSSIEAALDLALLIEREELADTVNIRATKVRGADVLPFSAVFTFENRPDGELHSARFYGIAANDNSSDAAIEREILEALSGASLNKTELTRAVKAELSQVGINRIRDRIDRLAATGRLLIANGKNNTEKIYNRP
ncbi:MAG: AAA family ATPase [Anaerolineales bacterium]